MEIFLSDTNTYTCGWSYPEIFEYAFVIVLDPVFLHLAVAMARKKWRLNRNYAHAGKKKKKNDLLLETWINMNYNHDKDVKVFFGEKFNDSGFPIYETSRLFEGRFFFALQEN